MTTFESVRMLPYEPSSTRSENPVIICPRRARSGRVASPTRGSTKKSPPATANTETAATLASTTSWRMGTGSEPAPGPAMASPATCCSSAIQLRSPTKPTKAKRNPTPNADPEAATSMKKARKAIVRESRTVWRVANLKRTRKSRSLTSASSTLSAR
jgi:hypothetical protein